MPSRITLRELAVLMNQPYIRVLAAALVDAGYLDDREARALAGAQEVRGHDRPAAM